MPQQKFHVFPWFITKTSVPNQSSISTPPISKVYSSKMLVLLILGHRNQCWGDP